MRWIVPAIGILGIGMGVAAAARAADIIAQPGPGDGFVILDSAGTVERLRVDEATGNVGIGTTVPQSHVHIDDTLDATGSGPSNLALLVRRNSIVDGGGPGIGFSSDNTPSVGAKIVHIRTSSNSKGDLAFYTKTSTSGPTTEKMRIKDNGNVGIGTTTPATNLDIRADGTTSLQLVSAGSDSTIRFGTGTAVNYTLGVDNSDADKFKIGVGTNFGPSSTTRLTLTSGGLLGIGTTNPQGALDVSGSIFQRGGVLHADYVFESNYDLESIEEHAKFMWENKQLPAIPGAQVDENGLEVIEVGSHRRGMLEELEKAHIYIEQLHQLNQELEVRLASLETLLGQGD